MAEIEHRQGRLDEGEIELVGLVELALHVLELRFQVGRLDLERRLVDGSGKVAIQQSVLHVCQFRLPLAQHLPPHGRGGTGVFECRLNASKLTELKRRFADCKACEHSREDGFVCALHKGCCFGR